MDLTESYLDALPQDVLERFEVRETRNAAAIFKATSAGELDQVIEVVAAFRLSAEDIVKPGGNKSRVAARLDRAFRELGWREGRHDTRVVSTLSVMPYRGGGERSPRVVETEVLSKGYKVDNVKGRVALDVEWNAKDGNLDRDLGAYRALYTTGIIDVGVIITRDQTSTRALALRLGVDRFTTTTTTNLAKLEPRLTRGDGGGCPVLVFAITDRCYDREAP